MRPRGHLKLSRPGLVPARPKKMYQARPRTVAFSKKMGVPGSSPCLTRERRLAPGALHPGVELRANRRSIHHRCHLFQVAFVLELTKETIYLPLGCLQDGISHRVLSKSFRKSQLPHKLVNVSFEMANIKNNLTDSCGN